MAQNSNLNAAFSFKFNVFKVLQNYKFFLVWPNDQISSLLNILNTAVYLNACKGYNYFNHGHSKNQLKTGTINIYVFCLNLAIITLNTSFMFYVP